MDELMLPKELPVMTLSGMTLFPGVIAPLYIFEPRYRKMLSDVLASHRMFCIAGQNDALASESGLHEPPFEIASVGIVRASQKNADETSHLVLQGLSRIRIEAIVQEEPYRLIRATYLDSEPGAEPVMLDALRQQMMKLIEARRRITENIAPELLGYLSEMESADLAVDLGVFTFCLNHADKQAMLEELNTRHRLERFNSILSRDNNALAIDKKLRGGLASDDIYRN